jgi:hypothetical protein
MLNKDCIKLQLLVLSFWTVHCLRILKKTKFRKLKLFPSSGERLSSMCLVESDRPRMETSSFRNVVPRSQC